MEGSVWQSSLMFCNKAADRFALIDEYADGKTDAQPRAPPRTSLFAEYS